MRSISTDLFSIIDKKLASNGAAQAAIKDQDARSLLCYAAETLVGVREKGGNNRGKEVELIQRSSGGRPGDAWCMWYVQALIAYVEKKLNIKSKIYHSGSCASVWEKTPKDQRAKIFPLAGAVVIWKNKKTGMGHTGIFIESTDKKTMLTSEGNSTEGLNSRGEVERDGGGVYLCKRSMKGHGNMEVRGFLIPFSKDDGLKKKTPI